MRSAHGPLALEELLCADVIADRDRVRGDPRLLAAPLVIVVPSRSLRLHVARKLVEWTGGACAGVEVLTLAGAARAVLFAAGLELPRGRLLFRTLVDEALRGEPELARELDAFDDAVTALAATVRDLLDAGFEPALLDAASEALERNGPRGNALERGRARAIVRVAARVHELATERGLAAGSDLSRRAALALGAQPAAWTARATWIHGFSDATGAALDLFEQWMRQPATRVYHDALANDAFGAGLRARLAIRAPAGAAPEVAASINLERAPNVDLEARSACDRVRTALDAGSAPEAIAILARDLGPYRSALRRHLVRLAIPFSSVGAAGSDGPGERRLRALAQLLVQRDECPFEQWLSARDVARPQGGAPVHLLLAGLRALGTPRLAAFATIDLVKRLGGAKALRLPIRVVSEIPETGDTAADVEPALHSEARRIPIETLAVEIERGRSTLARFTARTAAKPAAQHAAELRTFVDTVLGWHADTLGREAFLEALDAVVVDLPPALALAARTFDEIVAEALVGRIAPRFGGDGGGVQVLDVTEARGRSFAEVHVLGLARGWFPRVVRDDPLLGDAARADIASVLSDLGLKSVGRDEERVLFESLLRSAPIVHLSWPTLDESDKVLLPSVLLERVATPTAIEKAPCAADPAQPDHQATRTAAEHALAFGLQNGQAAFAAVARAAFTEAREVNRLAPDRPELAAARTRVLAEFEPDLAHLARLGPYFGFVGEARGADDLRGLPLHVTQVETLAKCGWQAFLRHVLKLEPPLDPAADLPDIDARLIGEVVHAVLESIHGAETKRGVWPAEADLDPFTAKCARRALGNRGILLDGFDVLVAARARPMLDIARAIDAADVVEAVLATEVKGALSVTGGLRGPRTLHFRADRSDRVEGGVRFTDYKTGTAIGGARKETTRQAHHFDEIARGTKLQAIVYALSAGATGSGRYAFLKENVDDDSRVFVVHGADGTAKAVFEEALATLLDTYDRGTFLPRLLDAKAAGTNDACASCEVNLACVRGDSTANRRLAAFVGAAGGNEDKATSAARALWLLAEKKAPVPAPPAAPDAPPKRAKKDRDQ